MAFTKAPAQDTHNVQRVPVQGSSVISSSTSTAPLSIRYSNCFPLKEGMWGTEAIMGVHKREGYKKTVCSGTITTSGPASQMMVQSANVYGFFAKGRSVYYVDYISNAVHGPIDTKLVYGYGTGTDHIDSSNVRRVAWLEAANGAGVAIYLMSIVEDGVTGLTTTDLGTTLNMDGTKGLVFIDGYLFAVNSDGTKIYNSAAGGNYTTWNSTDFLDAEQYADRISYIAKHKNYLVAFGTSSIEFFYDGSIEVGSPLARQENYATRVGLYPQNLSYGGGGSVVNVEDDLYFLGRSETNNVALCRVKNFQVEELGSQYIQNILNNTSISFIGLCVSVINNNPCIVVNFNGTLPWAYLIAENEWFELSGSDFPFYDTRVGGPIVPISPSASTRPAPCYTFAHANGSTSVIYKYETDTSYATSVTAQYTTQVIDFGVNRYKHLARVDLIGDYGNNTLSLGINQTPNYGSTIYSLVPTFQNASTNGYGQPVSWYNGGAHRRFSFQVGMEGTNPCIHRALEIEYNIGMT